MIDVSNNTITTVNALVHRGKEGEVKFLLAQEDDGNWGLPGGAKEIEDENLISTIRRELKEELNLNPEDYKLKETDIKREFEYNHFKSSRYGKHGVVQFFLVELLNDFDPRAMGELENVGWFTSKEAIDRLTFEHIKNGFEEASHFV
ncbi:MAG: hypothetical protein COV31_00015 [Candidatus Yanofskybacteria bacterium CG10_big_fil_rev_8_21_14_0_10_46_23]|uniref:Nudix hydrolase domain-containing protein n=1 Tax=Candidatus Yanofskybacteria bacterium CG10_big_fil_rev_8_21_14_0_10_46_23 TaxID=1975098 RepID=A0A2H0R558_9BACT|nr:MAG: hypothetical protein COV31_00015 [Candidatus Yanofskybacteria bacterium CG10_big_fil_rev_8_21_14_0_10_46_23]